jgi:peptidoglycan/xylan/chitin deacetylase (PgdA/CDA1 family)
MHRYFIKTPSWVRRLFPRYTWRGPADENAVYLTFDDGPHPTITPWVLDQLRSWNAKATFFCIGKNVAAYPDIYERIIDEGHAVGNHTQTHRNGWKTNTDEYIDDIKKASTLIRSPLFRPPYGKIRARQAGAIRSLLGDKTRIVMWDVLSADFDRSITAAACLKNVLDHTVAGSVIVFHDSEKAWPHLSVVLPEVLSVLASRGHQFRAGSGF